MYSPGLIRLYTAATTILTVLLLVGFSSVAVAQGMSKGQRITLSDLDCDQANQVAKFDGEEWECAPDNDTVIENTDTLDDLSCSTDEVASFDGSAWVCSSVNSLINIYEVRRPVSLESNPTLPSTTFWQAFCNVGDLAIGGGFETPAGTFAYRVTESHRYASDTRAWSTSILVAAGTITLDGAVYAYCLDLTS